MKKFLSKLLLFCIIVVAFDTSYGKICAYLIDHPKGGDIKLNQLICDSTKADVLIFGSSKAKKQYDPVILQDSLGMPVFNCGTNGMGIIYNYGRWKIISKRYTPKVLIYEFLPIVDLMIRDDNSIFINQLRPYYGKYKEIDSIFYKIDPMERYKMLSKTYQYHSLIDYWSCYNNVNWDKNGYSKPDNSVLDPKTVKYDKVVYDIDSLKLFYLEKFISEVSKKCKLIFAVSPMFSFKEDYGGLKKLKEICSEHNIPVLDHFCDTTFVNDPNLYIDMAHLNRKGSVKWSKMIASELKQVIKNDHF